MYIPGHMATAALVAAGVRRVTSRELRVRWVILPAVLGGLSPDLVDKPLQLLGLMRGGRTIGHSLFVLGALACVWGLWRSFGPRREKAPDARTAFGFWVFGIFTHHLADLADDALRSVLGGGRLFSSWFLWPVRRQYDWSIRLPEPLLPEGWGVWPWALTPLEIAVVLLAFVLGGMWLGRRGSGSAYPFQQRTQPSPRARRPGRGEVR